MLYRIIKKNQNKIFWTIGQFEFEYFGDSDVMNKLIIQDFNGRPFDAIFIQILLVLHISTEIFIPFPVEDLFSQDFEVGGTCLKVDILDTAGDAQFPAMRR